MKIFKKGQVVYFSGMGPTFGVIKRKTDFRTLHEEEPVRWELSVPGFGAKKYDACHESYLRLATPEEKEKFLQKYPEYEDGLPLNLTMGQLKLK